MIQKITHFAVGYEVHDSRSFKFHIAISLGHAYFGLIESSSEDMDGKYCHPGSCTAKLRHRLLEDISLNHSMCESLRGELFDRRLEREISASVIHATPSLTVSFSIRIIALGPCGRSWFMVDSVAQRNTPRLFLLPASLSAQHLSPQLPRKIQLTNRPPSQLPRPSTLRNAPILQSPCYMIDLAERCLIHILGAVRYGAW